MTEAKTIAVRGAPRKALLAHLSVMPQGDQLPGIMAALGGVSYWAIRQNLKQLREQGSVGCVGGSQLARWYAPEHAEGAIARYEFEKAIGLERRRLRNRLYGTALARAGRLEKTDVLRDDFERDPVHRIVPAASARFVKSAPASVWELAAA